MAACDAIVIGGGLVGSAVGYGLARQGLKIVVVDEGDVAYRASRGNFGLIWVQSKGAGCPEYQRWSRQSSELWIELAAELKERTGLDLQHRRRGGLHLCLSETEFENRHALLARIHAEAGDFGFDYQMLRHAELARMLPGLGPTVVGGSYTRYDGDVNPLLTLRALHAAILKTGGRYAADAPVTAIEPRPNAFTVRAGSETLSAPKLILAAGLGNKALGQQVRLNVPVRPQRGQILVTERVQPTLPMTTTFIRQTHEGGFMLGESQEETGFDDGLATDVLRDIARRAALSFPFLAQARIVRTWAALRVLPPDGLPVYDESREFPGAFVATCHSGVTLAAAHVVRFAQCVLAGAVSTQLSRFTSRRFDVQASS